MKNVQAKSNGTLNKLFIQHSLVSNVTKLLSKTQNYKACLALINCNEDVDNINKHIHFIYLHIAHLQLLISSSSSILTLIP